MQDENVASLTRTLSCISTVALPRSFLLVCEPDICVGGVYIDGLVPFWSTDYSYHEDIFGMFTLHSPLGFNGTTGNATNNDSNENNNTRFARGNTLIDFLLELLNFLFLASC